MNGDDYRRNDDSGDPLRWLAAGLGLGLLIGAALGVLFAPKSGRETREQLTGLATDLQQKARDYSGTVRDTTTQTYGMLAEKAQQVHATVKDTTRATTSTLKEGLASAKDAAYRAYDATVKVAGRVTKDKGGSEPTEGPEAG